MILQSISGCGWVKTIDMLTGYGWGKTTDIGYVFDVGHYLYFLIQCQ